ncbi:MAG: DUF881 domain-containing protein [Dactylosporangium sp.]|nr:DUF881 domain-containing protein [Dactylosporangium sp.]NNJ60674.1 DUF881 domain-containing protein [Dactylosporangium sp.]
MASDNPDIPPESPRRDTPAEGDPVGDRPSEGARRRLSAAGAMIGLLLGLLGFSLVAQFHGNTTDEQLASARPEDLVRILSDLDARQKRLQEEISDLEESRRQLESGAQGLDAALAEAKRRADELGILAGTLPAQGQGLAIVFAPRTAAIRASSLLDAVEELRGAGAEAMQIQGGTGATVRIVASTYLVDSDGDVLIDGVILAAPYTVEVIGDPQTMQTALQIPGGVIDSVEQRGGTVSVQQRDSVTVSALHHDDGLQYARPIS